jgi:K+-transporting ATPase KdpF subunit
MSRRRPGDIFDAVIYRGTKYGPIDDSLYVGVLHHRDLLYDRLRQVEIRGYAMSLENIFMLIISFLLMVYLVYALLRPEKF